MSRGPGGGFSPGVIRENNQASARNSAAWHQCDMWALLTGKAGACIWRGEILWRYLVIYKMTANDPIEKYNNIALYS